jgi:hypothetical protein
LILRYAFTVGSAFTMANAIVQGTFAVGLAAVMAAVNVVQTAYNAVQAITNPLMAQRGGGHGSAPAHLTPARDAQERA